MEWTGFEQNGEWKKNEQNPYVNWWNKTEGSPDGCVINLDIEDAEKIFDPRLAAFLERGQETEGDGEKGDVPGYEGSQHPLNIKAINKTFHENDPPKWVPDKILADAPAKGTVIVGIIDEGISLSHDEFRRRDLPDKTRIISAWQQSAVWGDEDDPQPPTRAQKFLPFGRELYQQDIDNLIAACTRKSSFDQDRFDYVAGLADMSDPEGPRSLNGRVGHGTHVADLAVGGTDTPIMVTNLPNRETIGLSGTFLEFFFYVALLRMINIADALWDRAHKKKCFEISGYPLVFNLSFSKTAGARDAVTGIAKRIAQINQFRREKGRSRIYLSLPAGNDNLLEGVGGFKLDGTGETKIRSFELECLPADQSPNFLEIWTTMSDNKMLYGQPPLSISVQAPGQGPQELQAGGDGHYNDLKDGENLLARLYSTVFQKGDVVDQSERSRQLKQPTRQRYILALCPTLSYDTDTTTAPAGRWKIKIQNMTDEPLFIAISVQSDQSVLPTSNNGLRAILVDEAPRTGAQPDNDRYRRFENNGRIRDSYSYGPDAPQNLDMPCPPGPARYVFRHGTLSALAMSLKQARTAVDSMKRTLLFWGRTPFIFISASHRQTDGQPAPYSSTGQIALGAFAIDSTAPDISLPTEDGATVPGISAAGARRGSKVALSGTSFAAAQTTRYIVNVLQRICWRNNRHNIKVLRRIVRCYADEFDYKVTKPKSGRARLKRAAPRDGRLASLQNQAAGETQDPLQRSGDPSLICTLLKTRMYRRSASQQKQQHRRRNHDNHANNCCHR